MGRSVRISEEAAKRLTLILGSEHCLTVMTLEDQRAANELECAWKRVARIPKSKPRQKSAFDHAVNARLRSRKPSKEEKRDRRAAIREKVFKRAEVDGVPLCEGPRWHSLLGPGPDFRSIYGRCGLPATELAHAFGKGKGRMPESERNCTAYCHGCAVRETSNAPTGAFWWEFRMAFFLAHGFTAEAREAGKRLAFVETRAALPAAPRVRRD